MSFLPSKIAKGIEVSRQDVAKSIQDLNRRERRLAIKASLNYAGFLILTEAGHDSDISYEDLYEFWAEEMDAPEEDFRAELDAIRGSGMVQSVGASPYAPAARYSLTNRFCENYYLGEDVD